MDIESAMVAKLAASGIQAFGAVPSVRPSRFVSLERVGGRAGRVIDEPTVAVQAWGTSWFDAHSLMHDALESLRDLPDGSFVTSLSVENVTRFEDESNQPRWQAMVSATCYTDQD